MAETTIYGASDDLIEFEGAIYDEFNAYGEWRGELTAPDGQKLIVTAHYGKPGAPSEWTLGIENSESYPSWPIRFTERPDCEGDPAIIIDVPEGTTVKEVI